MPDTKLRTSFVPKKTLAGGGTTSASTPLNLFLSIGLIFFFMTVAVAVGVFVYQGYVEKQLADQGKKLQDTQKAFQPELIMEVKKLDQRLSTAKQLLASHIAASQIFDILSRSTLQNVRFTDFKYISDKNRGASLLMTGETQNYSSIALQSDAFGEEKSFKSAAFSGLNPNEKGGVGFTVSIVLDSSALLYKNTLTAGGETAAVNPSESAIAPVQ